MKITTPSGKDIEIRKPTIKDNNIITDSVLARKGENITKFVESITGLDETKIGELLLGDITYILVQIRILSRGAHYETKAKCPHCGNVITRDIDLTKLREQKLDTALVEFIKGQYRFTLTLPESGDTLSARLLQAKDQARLNDIRTRYHAELLSYLMMLRTVSINGDPITTPEYVRTLRNAIGLTHRILR